MYNLLQIKPFKNEAVDAIDFERRFILPISLAGATFSLASILTNGILNLNQIIQLTPYVSFIVYIAIFLWAWYKENVTVAKYFILIFTLFLINFLWYYNYGSHGPILYLFILLYSYLIFMVSGRQLIFFTLLISINIAILFYTEYNYPDIITDYSTRQQQVVDVFMSMLFYGLIVFILMSIAKISYVNAYMEAKKAERLKTSFLENMSHEIRTPLNAIVGFSNLLADESLCQNERNEYIELINDSNQSLLRLVNDILDVSLIEADQLTLSKADVDINELLAILEKTYRLILNKKNKNMLHLIIEVPKQQFILVTDATRLKQVFINLLDNAVKFTDKGAITFGVSEEKENLIFYVKDTGIGIEKKYKFQLFDRFFKVEENKDTLFRGTGIGLFLCKRIVEMMGGKIWLESQLNKGTEFKFTIPKNGFRKLDTFQPVQTKKIELPDGQMKVLVVEDQPSSLIYFKIIFKSMNMDVLQATDGRQGVEMFKAHPDIDLVLMDLKMPVMDGFEALKEIRKLNPTALVVAQTAFAMEKDRERCLEAGFTAYIAKPIDKDTLMNICMELGLVK